MPFCSHCNTFNSYRTALCEKCGAPVEDSSDIICRSEGYVDYADWQEIRGWAADRGRPNQPLAIEIWEDSKLIVSVIAAQDRPDIGTLMSDDGRHGFAVQTPTCLKDGKPHTIQIRVSKSTQLTNSPVSYSVAPHVWNHNNPGVSQRYRAMAVRGARALPESVAWELFQAFVADTRGESFPLGPDVSAVDSHDQQFWIWFKDASETAARQAGIALTGEDLALNLAWLIQHHSSMNLRNATEAFCDYLKCWKRQMASLDELRVAEEWLEQSIYSWLKQNDVKVYEAPLTIIPTTALQRALSDFRAKPDIHFAPEIPPDKLQNAIDACGTPSHETISILIDSTFWGSATDSVLFGSRGIYFNNEKATLNGFLPYCEFPLRTFNFTTTNAVITLGNGEQLSLDGSNVSPALLITMLEIVKKEALSRLKLNDAAEGLSTIPGMSKLKKQLLEDVVDVLKNVEEYKKYKISIPNGILFYGPPGCGKTFVAQRLAKELDYNFFEVSPGSIASTYIHGSVLEIRSIFENAARNAPALIFVDEFEGLVPSRRELSAEAQYKSEEVNEWLVQIGSCSEKRILFLAATNEPWKIDEAVQRTGRLDKKIYIGPPDRDALEQMLRYHLDGRPLANPDEPRIFAEHIDGQGYSASDIKALVDEAAKVAMRQRAPIACEHLRRAAVESVPPSISEEQEETYRGFR